jgi:hypothetical protein
VRQNEEIRLLFEAVCRSARPKVRVRFVAASAGVSLTGAASAEDTFCANRDTATSASSFVLAERIVARAIAVQSATGTATSTNSTAAEPRSPLEV